MKAENNKRKRQHNVDVSAKKDKTYVYPIRDWKEYLGESILIVFSVLLALGVTEYINKFHEREYTKRLLKSIVIELKNNKRAIQEMNEYNMQVLGKIDSALGSRDLQHKLVSNDEFHLKEIAPQGVLYRYTDNDAWTIAKNNNIMSKIDIESISILTKVYEEQDRIKKVEEEVARVLFDRASRNPAQVHKTLMIIRDIYHAWAVDRVPGLLSTIDAAIMKIESD